MTAPVRRSTRRLLSVSRSTPLLIGRNDMLAIAGYSVSSPREPLDALILLQHEDFRAVLIGHSVLPEEAATIAAKASVLRIPVIFIFQGRVAPPDWADIAVDNDSGMGRLMDFLDQKTQE